MTEEELLKIRNVKDYLINKRGEILYLQEKIRQFEQTPEVKRYLELKAAYDELGVSKRIGKYTDEEILQQSINSVEVINSSNNKIYVFMGSYKYIEQPGYITHIYEIKTHNNSQEASFNIYRNVELNPFDSNYELKIQIEKHKEFENNNIVIYPNTENIEDFYYDIKNRYYNILIDNSEKEAIKEMKKLRKERC